jgi:hypothetical protein
MWAMALCAHFVIEQGLGNCRSFDCSIVLAYLRTKVIGSPLVVYVRWQQQTSQPNNTLMVLHRCAWTPAQQDNCEPDEPQDLAHSKQSCQVTKTWDSRNDAHYANQ